MDNDIDLTIARLAPRLRRKEISPLELTKYLLERISRLQPALNAFITVTAEMAIAQARRVESEIARGGYKGALHGIPISLKDLFHTRGIRTTAGSLILKNFVPKENALVVERLLACGCVLLGKTNMHEFAYGATNLNPHYGPVRNPWNPRCISGGSSGGSAVSVISAQAVASLGTDTGGSIRIPSAACGCVGLKPTYGLVPMHGVIPLARTLDHAGPLCRCVTDAAILLDAIAAPSPCAPSVPIGNYASQIRKGAKGLKIAIPRQYFFELIQPDVLRAVLAAVPVFERLGARIREVDLKGMHETGRLAADITAGEALAFHEKWLTKTPHKYGSDLRSRLRQSRSMKALSYIQARQETRAYAEQFARILDSVDLILAPTIPVAAPHIDQTKVRIGRRHEDIRPVLLSLTRPANLCGLPAISIPCGFSSEGLPFGLQLMGRRYDEATILRAAYAYERATPWHTKFPGCEGFEDL
jgi:aspartyl-tRNA(Asn)/glutamyl-tRNA(Gln) amidotransferase subunit A